MSVGFLADCYHTHKDNADVLMAIVVIGIYLGFKREFSKLIGFLVVALVAVGLVFNAGGVKDVLLELFNKIIGASVTIHIRTMPIPIPSDTSSKSLTNSHIFSSLLFFGYSRACGKM